jgi:hypothetical protein
MFARRHTGHKEVNEYGMTAFDAVDGSSTRRASAMDGGAVKAPTIRRATYANGHDNRSRYREVGFSSPRR